MQVHVDGTERSYKSQLMLQDVVKRRLGENESRVPWVPLQQVDGKWTAIIFLPTDFSHLARPLAEFGFKVYN